MWFSFLQWQREGGEGGSYPPDPFGVDWWSFPGVLEEGKSRETLRR